MSDKEFKEFMATLIPMRSADKKSVNYNYKRILAKGFRCDRKRNCYTHPSGRSISWRYESDGYAHWVEITTEEYKTAIKGINIIRKVL